MPKIFTTVVKKRRVIVQGGSSSGEVERDALRVDHRATSRKAAERSAVAVRSQEVSRKAVETVTAAVLGEARETGRRAVESINATVVGTANELGRRAADRAAMAVAVSEVGRRAVDQATAIIIPTTDQAKRAVESTPLTVRATANDSGRRAVEQVAAVIAGTAEQGKRAAASDAVTITLAGYANAVASNTGFTNPNNALGNTTGTAATLVATATGLAGTTNNTATGTLVLDFQDVNLGDLTISAVMVNVERQGATAGVPVAQPTSAVNFQYSFDNTNWTTIFALTTPATAKAVSTLDLTAAVGQDQSKLSALKVRATGTITSGTGLGATNTVSFFRAWMTVSAARTY